MLNMFSLHFILKTFSQTISVYSKIYIALNVHLSKKYDGKHSQVGLAWAEKNDKCSVQLSWDSFATKKHI